jgi:hypothetical protein
VVQDGYSTGTFDGTVSLARSATDQTATVTVNLRIADATEPGWSERVLGVWTLGPTLQHLDGAASFSVRGSQVALRFHDVTFADADNQPSSGSLDVSWVSDEFGPLHASTTFP